MLEVDIEWLEDQERRHLVPYLSVADAQKLDTVRESLRRGDLEGESACDAILPSRR